MIAATTHCRIVRGMQSLSRRDFVRSATAAVIASACCRPRDTVNAAPPQPTALLYSRPTTPHDRPEPGLRPLALGDQRDGFIYIPPTYTPLQASPLLVMLHGASQSARQFAHNDVGQYFDKDA